MSQADGPAGMLSPGGTLPQEGAGSQNESWRSQEETWRLRFRITELLNSLEEKLLFRQLFQEETERKEKKWELFGGKTVSTLGRFGNESGIQSAV